ncbi:MAG TPA: PLAT/LH2 domain-containing protein [Candidatus Acidoferrum sp.]|nr:PLAT/LH2 domain-containing protein [Candidatus Acidoferrum sp.]
MADDSSGSVHSGSEGGVIGKHAAPDSFEFLVAPTTSNEFNTARLRLIPIACFRIDDVRFKFDSSFVLPDVKAEMDAFLDLRKQDSRVMDAPVSIFGHADPAYQGNFEPGSATAASGDDYNKTLSGRRAIAIYALLIREPGLWENLYSNHFGGDVWGEEAIRTMLAAVDQSDPSSRQSRGNSPRGTSSQNSSDSAKNSLVRDIAHDSGQRQQLFLKYMNLICGALKLDKSKDFLARGSGTDQKGDVQGCSRFNPVLLFSGEEEAQFKGAAQKQNKGLLQARNSANAPNRRVMILIFRKGSQILPDKWPCPTYKEKSEGCKKRFFSNGDARRSTHNSGAARKFEETKDTFACRFYQRLSINSPCNQPAPNPCLGPRPFYVVGHNPNTIKDVLVALDAGANAIEPDINVYSHDESQLCVSHGEGDKLAPRLTDFLDDVRKIALQRPALSMVVFDCKPKVATPEHGATLLAAIRQHLIPGTNLNFIISTSSLDGKAMFDRIASQIGPREGCMIDEENDPVQVSDFFSSKGVRHQGFGNGISFLNVLLGPHVRPSMERACEYRAATANLRFIYVWTVNAQNLEREYIRIGVDGIITDSPQKLRGILMESEFQKLVRLATRQDDPYRPAACAYGLEVQTGNLSHAGTDAKITFTLTGSQGSASVTVDSSLPKRMETGDLNFVTLQTSDLGSLQSITVQRDNSGNAPDWFLDHISVKSARFGASARAAFNRWIDSTAPFTQPLLPLNS